VRSYLALAQGQAASPQARLRIEQGQRQEAEQAAYRELKRASSWLPRAAIFRFVLARTREGVRRRENLRFARTKIYNIARNMFRALGERFTREGILDDAADVFYLTTDEIWDYVQGAAVSVNLRSIAEARRLEYDEYRSSNITAPAKRFETYGVPYFGNDYLGAAMRHQTTQSDILHGTSCCPGVVVGTVQLCDRPVAAAGIVGDILVAESTDPGWVTMFPAFRGILVERGSVLSHSAIVAREMGIPTIVGVTSLMARLRTGQRIRMDGARATIEILSEPDVEDCSKVDAEARRDAIAATG
jgi:rifampicin phosphotransferase